MFEQEGLNGRKLLALQETLAVVDSVATAAAAVPEDLTYEDPDDLNFVAAEGVGEVPCCWDIVREVAAENVEE